MHTVENIENTYSSIFIEISLGFYSGSSSF